jgi:hypothetical protein
MKNIIGCIITTWLFLFGTVCTMPAYAKDFAPTYCENETGIATAIGCIPATSSGIANKLLGLSIGIGGGIAFLLILIGALQIQISTGNPDRIHQGREIIQGAIIGLLMIVCSVYILRVIGMDILAIPGFQP